MINKHHLSPRYRYTPQTNYSPIETESFKSIIMLQNQILELEKKYSKFVEKCSDLISISNSPDLNDSQMKEDPVSMRLSIDNSPTVRLDQEVNTNLINTLENNKFLKKSMLHISEITNKSINLILGLNPSSKNFQEKLKANSNKMLGEIWEVMFNYERNVKNIFDSALDRDLEKKKIIGELEKYKKIYQEAVEENEFLTKQISEQHLSLEYLQKIHNELKQELVKTKMLLSPEISPIAKLRTTDFKLAKNKPEFKIRILRRSSVPENRDSNYEDEKREIQTQLKYLQEKLMGFGKIAKNLIDSSIKTELSILDKRSSSPKKSIDKYMNIESPELSILNSRYSLHDYDLLQKNIESLEKEKKILETNLKSEKTVNQNLVYENLEKTRLLQDLNNKITELAVKDIENNDYIIKFKREIEKLKAECEINKEKNNENIGKEENKKNAEENNDEKEFLKKSLRVTELENLIENYRKTDEENKEKISEMSKEIDSKKSENIEISRKSNKRKVKTERLIKEINDKIKENFKISLDINSKNNEISELQNNISYFSIKISSIENENLVKTNKITDLQLEVQKNCSKVSELENQIQNKNCEIAILQKDLLEKSKEFSDFEENLETKISEILILKKNVQKLNIESHKLQNELFERNTEISKLENELFLKKSEISQAEAKLQNSSFKISDLQQELQLMKFKFNDIDEDQNKSAEKISNLETKVRENEEKAHGKIIENGKLKIKLSELNSEIANKNLKISELEQENKRFSRTLSSLENDIKDKSIKISDFEFVSQSTSSEICVMEKEIMGRNIRIKEIEKENINLKQNNSKLISDLQEKISKIYKIDSELSVCNNKFLEIEKKIKDENNKVKELLDESSQNKNVILSLNENLNSLNIELANLTKKLEEKIIELATSRKELIEKNQLISKLQNKVNKKNSKITKLNSEISALDKNIKENISFSSTLESKNIEIQAKNADLQIAFEKISAEFAKIQKKLLKKKAEILILDQELSKKHTERISLNNELSSTLDKNSSLSAEIQEKNFKITELINKCKKQADFNTTILQDSTKIQKKIEDLQEKYEYQTNTLERTSTQLKETLAKENSLKQSNNTLLLENAETSKKLKLSEKNLRTLSKKLTSIKKTFKTLNLKQDFSVFQQEIHKKTNDLINLFSVKESIKTFSSLLQSHSNFYKENIKNISSENKDLKEKLEKALDITKNYNELKEKNIEFTQKIAEKNSQLEKVLLEIMTYKTEIASLEINLNKIKAFDEDKEKGVQAIVSKYQEEIKRHRDYNAGLIQELLEVKEKVNEKNKQILTFSDKICELENRVMEKDEMNQIYAKNKYDFKVLDSQNQALEKKIDEKNRIIEEITIKNSKLVYEFEKNLKQLDNLKQSQSTNEETLRRTQNSKENLEQNLIDLELQFQHLEKQLQEKEKTEEELKSILASQEEKIFLLESQKPEISLKSSEKNDISVKPLEIKYLDPESLSNPISANSKISPQSSRSNNDYNEHLNITPYKIIKTVLAVDKKWSLIQLESGLFVWKDDIEVPECSIEENISEIKISLGTWFSGSIVQSIEKLKSQVSNDMSILLNGDGSFGKHKKEFSFGTMSFKGELVEGGLEISAIEKNPQEFENIEQIKIDLDNAYKKIIRKRKKKELDKKHIEALKEQIRFCEEEKRNYGETIKNLEIRVQNVMAIDLPYLKQVFGGLIIKIKIDKKIEDLVLIIFKILDLTNDEIEKIQSQRKGNKKLVLNRK